LPVALDFAELSYLTKKLIQLNRAQRNVAGVSTKPITTLAKTWYQTFISLNNTMHATQTETKTATLMA